MRILTKPDQTIPVAPEGVHQDGYNRIGMFMISYQNLSGGELKVHKEKEGPVIVKYLLNNGEYLLLNDDLFWHDAEDISCTSDNENGYYDLFVLTSTKVS